MAGKNPDIDRPALSGAQVQTTLFNQALNARAAFPQDPEGLRRELSMRQVRLAGLPQIALENVKAPSPTHTTFSRVPLNLMASLGTDGSWEKELDTSSPEIFKAAEAMLDTDPESSEKLFHLKETPFDRVRVTAYEGPLGPIYTGVSGAHRTAGALVAGVESVYADVERISYPCFIEKTLGEVEPLLRAGLIKGNFEADETGREVFRVTNAVVPWIFSSPEAIAEIGAAYLNAYPNGFESLPVPPEVLSDAQSFKEFIRDHRDNPPAALKEFIDTPGPAAQVKEGEAKDVSGIAQSQVSLQAKRDTPAFHAAPGSLRKRNLALSKGYLLSYGDDMSGGRMTAIRDTYGNVGSETTMVPSGWKAVWVHDSSMNRPYGSDYRVIVYNPAQYAVDETGTVGGKTVENFAGTRLIKREN